MHFLIFIADFFFYFYMAKLQLSTLSYNIYF